MTTLVDAIEERKRLRHKRNGMKQTTLGIVKSNEENPNGVFRLAFIERRRKLASQTRSK
jgi:hypothetical protein